MALDSLCSVATGCRASRSVKRSDEREEQMLHSYGAAPHLRCLVPGKEDDSACRLRVALEHCLVRIRPVPL
jgi:hypothetical protein